jgi:LPXTG-site transpeptidase (sortase) family protein
METRIRELWDRKKLLPSQRFRLLRLLSAVLSVLGVLFLLAAAIYAGYARLNTWLMSQDLYLVSDDILPLAAPAATRPGSPTATPSPHYTPTSAPILSVAPPPSPTPQPLSPAVQIRIPAIGVTRSIVELPRIRDDRTGAWTWDTKSLFRSGRSDLVGHWQGSANPGQAGNMVLVGHNYGYGYNGVFVQLGRLKAGQQVILVNKAGQTFTYEVKSVNHVKWKEQDLAELTQHLQFLALGGDEHLTLVSCAGADLEPFPERVYVVAEPLK